MGLDMYAYKTKAEIADVDFEFPEDAVLICEWWKHPNLHGWMESLYRSKGGSEIFNCVPVKLDAVDLQALEGTIKRDALPITIGFFFGESSPEEKADDLAFVRDALDALKAGYSVFYRSWW